MIEPSQSSDAVQPGDPCPFLRALVAGGELSGQRESLVHASEVIARAFPANEPKPALRAAVVGIAAIAHGIDPISLATTARKGLRPNELRDGPLDKHGAGSRILDVVGQFDPEQFARLEEFAADYTDADTGLIERGLGLPELTTMMDANFARAHEFRRRYDRKLMDGEWPVLLRVMGKSGEPGSYLSLVELRELFADRVLPKRVRERLDAGHR